MKEALFYTKLADNAVQCLLCPHECRILPGKRGLCGVRQNIDGVLKTLVADKVIACHADPIEKKPLFHVLPGSRVLSIATVGCNFSCRFCQNSDISQYPQMHLGPIPGETMTPEQIVARALREECQSIAYTYTEPTVYFELALECAIQAKDAGLLNIFVTNGYINPGPLRRIAPFLDAANVDLKSFDETFYQKMTGGSLKPVLDSLRLMQKLGIFLEITTLIIPDENDDPKQLREIADFIVQELGPDTPWHISRFYPQFKMQFTASTPVETIHRAREIGLDAGLKYVYVGNVSGDDGEHTFCPECGRPLIERFGFQMAGYYVRDGHCPECNAQICGIGL